MPGIYGEIVLSNENTNIQSFVNGNFLVHEDWQHLQELKYNRVTLGVVKNGSAEGAIYENGQYCIAFFGEIYEVIDQNISNDSFPIIDAKIVLSIIQEYGIEKAVNFNGNWLLALFDKNSNTLLIQNDRFGVYPIFYRLMDNTVCFASEAMALFSKGAAEPDYVGIAEYLSFDYCLKNRTVFKDVLFMRPAEQILVDSKGFHRKIYWKIPEVSDKGGSRGKWEQRLQQVLKEAVMRRCSTGDDYLIGLTGGFDARLLTAILMERRLNDGSSLDSEINEGKVKSFTFGNARSGDVVAAEGLANIYGIQHHYIKFTEGMGLSAARKIIISSSGMCSSDRFYIWYAAMEKRKYGNIEISGSGGDAISGQKSNFTGIFPIMSRRLTEKQRSRLCNKIFHNAMRGRLSVENADCYGRVFKDNVWNDVYNDWCDVFRECGGETFGNLTMQLKMRTLERQSTMPHIALCNQFITMRYPIYDYHVVDFFARMPQKYRHGQNLYIKIIEDFYPKAARIPHSETGRPIHGNSILRIDMVTVWKFLKGKLHIRACEWHRTFAFVKDIIIKEKDSTITELIGKNNLEMINGIFDLSEYKDINTLIDKAKGGDGKAYTILIKLINLGIMNQEFFGGKLKLLAIGK